mmetsp:Transcript_27378/g.41440  ORF Transcript_27378/g.41440 Transcript_27378/m.41440 type:complete len:311 (-) Transcript_27378:1348-2280(-)
MRVFSRSQQKLFLTTASSILQNTTENRPWYEKWLVVTDLDGTLLDHHDYSFQAARPALDLLQRHEIPLVLSSSKTLDEMKVVANDIGIHNKYPLIVENGAAIAWPASNDGSSSLDDEFLVDTLGKISRNEVVQQAHQLREKYAFEFEGFADWQVSDVETHTGLSPMAAELSMQRYGTEPILWRDPREDAYEKFVKELEKKGIRAVRGGRFIHLMGQFVDKADGLAKVAKKLQRDSTLALGDSPNDLSMLNAADVAVKIPQPQCKSEAVMMDVQAPVVLKPREPGPQGWCAACLAWWQAEGSSDSASYQLL